MGCSENKNEFIFITCEEKVGIFNIVRKETGSKFEYLGKKPTILN